MVLCSCSGEDRSDEMPRIPVVSTVSATVNGNSCTMNGTVVESHNSSLRECGFFYGETGAASVKIKADTTKIFEVKADSLEAGDYYCVAYAKNGMGVSYGDTVEFIVR
ncbi:MAG: hypothetical protein PUG41_01605 [Prevotellaceae bacterium]|jgi:hypothetical protein|nr:hypothetical protein [Prevotellaceae bacterium]